MNMSYRETQKQMYFCLKTVTRRMEHTWKKLKRGDVIIAVEQAQGLPKGGHVIKIGPIKILDVRVEPLNIINRYEVIREGFPWYTPSQFIEFFCKLNKCEPNTKIRRIQFKPLYEPWSVLADQSYFRSYIAALKNDHEYLTAMAGRS